MPIKWDIQSLPGFCARGDKNTTVLQRNLVKLKYCDCYKIHRKHYDIFLPEMWNLNKSSKFNYFSTEIRGILQESNYPNYKYGLS